MARKMRDMRRRLITPEGVDLGVVLGELGQRAAAFMLDALLLCAVLVMMSLIALFGVFGVGASAWQPIAIIWLLGFFILRNFYFIFMEMRPRAATFGKRWVGLRVIARDGGRLSGDAVIARNLMREIEIFLPLSFIAAGQANGQADGATALFGLVWTGAFLFFPYFNADRLRVGDLLAGTWVIRTKGTGLARDLSVPSDGATFIFDAAQLDAYGVLELEVLEGVLRRPESGERLPITQAIIDRIGWATEVSDLDTFLTDYYTQLRAHLERRLLLGKRRADKHDSV